MSFTPDQQKFSTPIISRDPDKLPTEFLTGSEIPDDLDPFADGILMAHQAAWLEDQSPLKIAVKGRRTGITFAEALDNTIIAATKRSEGGDNIFYIGDTQKKGREYIGYVAHFAKVVAGQLGKIEDFIFKDEQPDGSTKDITAFRVTFASGFRVEALSSNPSNIRGLQGTVVIDEAAFHSDVREVIDAVNALLIWESKVRIISTHNGLMSPFNELVTEARAGKNSYVVHDIPFQMAVDNGLYKRVCAIKGKPWTQKAQDKWEALICGSYGTRTSKMKQELDAVPTDAEGAVLTRVEIERVTEKGIPIIRWNLEDEFKWYPKNLREAAVRDFCREKLDPILKKLDPKRKHVFGEDFARTGDRTAIVIFEIGRDLVRRQKFIVELGNCPFETQRDVLFHIGDNLPKLHGGALDATGNGHYLAEVCAQRWGPKIIEVKFTLKWYQENASSYTTAFGDQTVTLAADEDVVRDHQALSYVNGIIKVPDDHRNKGEDGFNRHGDTAIAGMLAWYVSKQDAIEHDGYQSSRSLNSGGEDFDRDNYRRSGGLW